MKKTIEKFDLPESFYELPLDQQKALLNWIKLNFIPIKTFSAHNTSYGLKHLFEESTNGFYITNGQFKGAMVKNGYNVKDKNALNWHFNISKKSPALKKNKNN